jgi:hypothetical protein
MCCLVTILALLGPRAAILIWYLFQPSRWNATFETIVWPLLGALFLPWTTLMYVLVAPGGVAGWDWVWMILAVLIDLGSYGGGGYGNRDRIRG